MNKPDSVSPLQIAGKLNQLWSPRVIAELDDSYVKVAKLHGTFTWHCHEQEDELFLILKGQLRMEYENHVVDLDEGDLHVVPKGVMHNPIAADECLVMLIERKSTLHTGILETEGSRAVEEQLEGYIGRPNEKETSGSS